MIEQALPQTTLQQTLIEDLADIFTPSSAPNAQQVVTPNIFSKEGVEMEFLDKKQETQEKTSSQEGNDKPASENNLEVSTPTSKPAMDSIEAIVNESNQEDDEDGEKKLGRPKTDKSGLIDFFKKQIENGRLFTFDDYDENKESLDNYLERLSPKDFEELWEANHNESGRKSQEEISKQFFESLHTELQYAYKYVADGGQDLRGLFQALSKVEEVRSLDVEDEKDQEEVYRQYLSAINFGSPEEIEEEITTWKDLGQLDKKAKQAKPKLDKMQEQMVTRQLQQQEQLRQQEEAAAQAYVEHVYQALEPGEINGLRLDKKTQSFLYNSMVSAQYPSITGKPTNLLGHLLEKYQFIEPNYPLITEALWLLSDPQGYRTMVKQSGANEAVQKTVRALKTEESRKAGSSMSQQTEVVQRSQRKITKPGNIFKRS
jgi:hypothetical protein